MSTNEERIPPGMIMYTNGVEPFINYLSDEQAGILFKALFAYHLDGVIPEFNEPFISAAFDVIRRGIDDGRTRYRKSLEGSEKGVAARKEKAAGKEKERTEKENEHKETDSLQRFREQEFEQKRNNVLNMLNPNPP